MQPISAPFSPTNPASHTQGIDALKMSTDRSVLGWHLSSSYLDTQHPIFQRSRCKVEAFLESQLAAAKSRSVPLVGERGGRAIAGVVCHVSQEGVVPRSLLHFDADSNVRGNTPCYSARLSVQKESPSPNFESGTRGDL